MPDSRNESAIQKAVNEIFTAAETQMDRIIELEAEHGKCYNFISTADNYIWYFEDGHKEYFKSND